MLVLVQWLFKSQQRKFSNKTWWMLERIQSFSYFSENKINKSESTTLSDSHPMNWAFEEKYQCPLVKFHLTTQRKEWQMGNNWQVVNQHFQPRKLWSEQNVMNWAPKSLDHVSSTTKLRNWDTNKFSLKVILFCLILLLQLIESWCFSFSCQWEGALPTSQTPFLKIKS